ncbi:putative ribonuclease H-like domain-containing protein [Tanacetum coccineum]
MDLETPQTNATAKFPILKQGEYEMWRQRIEQYFQVQDCSMGSPVTTEEKAQKKNDVKARSMLLMALPNEHQLTFNQYKDAKTLFDAIQTRFGVVWRNKSDLDSIDDLYNNFNIVEQEVKRTITSNSNSISSSQNMAFVSSSNSTNEVNTTNVQVITVNSHVSIADTPDSTANLSDVTIYAFLENQLNGSQIVHEDLEQIHKDDLEEMDLKWEYRGPRNQDNRNRNQDSSRRNVNVEETSSKAMVAINGVGFDWSFMADEEVPTNMALMAFSDSEVHNDKTCLFAPPTIDLSNYSLEEFQQPEFKGYGPKATLTMYRLTAITIKGKGWNMTPKAVLMKIGLKPLNTTRPVNIAHPKTIVYSARPMSCFSKLAQSTVKRTYQSRTTLTNKNFNQKVNTAKEKVYTAKPKAVNTARPTPAAVNAVRANQATYPISQTLRNLIEDMLPLGEEPEEEELLFDSSSKISSDDEPQPSSNAEKKNDEGVSKASGFSDQEQPKSSTLNINTTGPSINTASANFKTGNLNINIVSPTVITTRSNRSQNVSDMFSLGRSATHEATHADLFGDETEMNMSNLTTSYQTRGMTKNINKHGFISVIYEGKTHEDLHTCLFACFLSQEEQKRIAKDLYYDEAFAHVARIEAIRLFLAYASFLGFMVYQMDVKSSFLYGTIEEEVYVCQPLRFEDPDYPDKVYKVVKAMYSLHLAPRAWYGTLAKYLLDNCFQRGKIDHTLFIKKQKRDIFLVRVYINDIIFGSKNKELCTKFEKLMHDKFQMSSMRELYFFLGLKVKQREDGIFINQEKYVAEILWKFGFTDVRTASTLMDTEKPLLKDSDGDDVDVHLYRSMFGSLMYLTSSRPDIVFAVCACARFQVTPKVSHSHTIKRIFRYLKGQPKLGLWYPRNSPIDLVAYSDSDYAGESLDRKSTTGGC